MSRYLLACSEPRHLYPFAFAASNFAFAHPARCFQIWRLNFVPRIQSSSPRYRLKTNFRSNLRARVLALGRFGLNFLARRPSQIWSQPGLASPHCSQILPRRRARHPNLPPPFALALLFLGFAWELSLSLRSHQKDCARSAKSPLNPREAAADPRPPRLMLGSCNRPKTPKTLCSF